MTDQEQVTVLEQWTQKGMHRWILRPDGKRMELPFQEWMHAEDGPPVIRTNPIDAARDAALWGEGWWKEPKPAEPECTAIVHLADKEKV